MNHFILIEVVAFVLIMGIAFVAARFWGWGPMTMNGEGPKPQRCRQCGDRLASRIATGHCDPRSGRVQKWEQLYCPKNHGFTWSYHWLSGWQEDWDV